MGPLNPAFDGNDEEAALVAGILNEFENFERKRILHKQDHQRKLPLWLFMIAVSRADHKQICLSWKRCEKYEFIVKDRELLAKLWGFLKGNSSMDYSKLSRALRYYYKKNLIEKVADQPYTYRFIISETTLLYLPTQEELMKYRVNEEAASSNQRPKSLPNFFNVFHRLFKNENRCANFSDTVPIDSVTASPPSSNLLLVPKDKRVRAASLPSPTTFQRQNSNGSSKVTSTESTSDAPTSPIDEMNEMLWVDQMELFPFKERSAPEKIPETACFKPLDLPLLSFNDMLKLENDKPDCYSPLSVCSSDQSCDMELCEDTSFWMSKMRQNPELKLSFELAEPGGLGEGNVNDSIKKENDSLKEIDIMDMDIEMDIVQQVIHEHYL